MDNSFIKYFFMMICSLYIFFKLLNISISKKDIYTGIGISLIAQIPLYFIRLYAPIWFIPGTVILLCFVASFTTNIASNTAFITSVISYSLSYFAFFFPSIIMTPITIILKRLIPNQDFVMTIAFFLIGICQFITASIPFRFNRLKKGMPFIHEKAFNTIGIIISIIILTAAFILGMQETSDSILIMSLLSVALFGLLLIIWWLRQITKNYIHKLRNREIEELQVALAKEKEDKERLAKLVHKDNKLIPAMEMAVRDLLETGIQLDCDAAFQLKASQLLSELEALTRERQGILHTNESHALQFPTTGQTRIDSLLQFMQQKAFNQHISFHFTQTASFKHMTQTLISEELLTTIIADLLENALIATKEQPVKNILLSLNIEDGAYCLSVADSGLSFSPEVIGNLGQVATTTHKDSGGSGIGLMTICEILRQHKGSLHIEEFINNPDYTKKLTLCFDGKNQVVIHSRRPEIVCLSMKRPDIIFTD